MADIEDTIGQCGAALAKYEESVSETSVGTLIDDVLNPALASIYNPLHDFITSLRSKKREEKDRLPERGRRLLTGQKDLKYDIMGKVVSLLFGQLKPAYAFDKDWDENLSKANLSAEQKEFVLRQRTKDYLGMSDELFNSILRAIEENPHSGIAGLVNGLLQANFVGSVDKPGDFLRYKSGLTYQELFPKNKYTPKEFGTALSKQKKFSDRYTWVGKAHPLLLTPHEGEAFAYGIFREDLDDRACEAYGLKKK